MLVVSATSQVGLQLCLCEKTVFMDDCPCAEYLVVDKTSTCSSCDSCSRSEGSVAKASEPCGDCNLTIEIEFDDCVPQVSPDFKITNDYSLLAYQGVMAHQVLLPLSPEMTCLDVRGSPPQLQTTATPLYIRHSVFLI